MRQKLLGLDRTVVGNFGDIKAVLMIWWAVLLNISTILTSQLRYHRFTGSQNPKFNWMSPNSDSFIRFLFWFDYLILIDDINTTVSSFICFGSNAVRSQNPLLLGSEASQHESSFLWTFVLMISTANELKSNSESSI